MSAPADMDQDEERLAAAMLAWLALPDEAKTPKKKGFFQVRGGWWKQDRAETAAAFAEAFPRGMERPRKRGKQPKCNDDHE